MSTLTIEESGIDEDDYYQLEAVDITGTNVVTLPKVEPSISAQNLAGVLASRLQLPTNIPWMLRSDRSGAFLQEDAPIRDQVQKTGDRVVLTPKTHLGAPDSE
jgi:hypothetical protein